VRVGVSTADAAYRYDRLHTRLVRDLRRDWDYNTDARLDVYCEYARRDPPAIGASRTVMRPDGTSIELDDDVVCKVRDPRKGGYQLGFTRRRSYAASTPDPRRAARRDCRCHAGVTRCRTGRPF